MHKLDQVCTTINAQKNYPVVRGQALLSSFKEITEVTIFPQAQ